MTLILKDFQDVRGRLDFPIDNPVENDSCLYLAVSVKGEFVAEDSSEALANITVPHGSFVPSNTL